MYVHSTACAMNTHIIQGTPLNTAYTHAHRQDIINQKSEH